MFGVSRYVLPYWLVRYDGMLRLILEITNRHRKNGNLKLSIRGLLLESCASLVAQHAPVLKAEDGTCATGWRGSWLRFLVPWVVICVVFYSWSFYSILLGRGCGEQVCHLGDYVSCMYHLSQRCHPTPARIWRWPSLPLATRAMKVPTTSHAKQFCVCVLQVFMSRNFTSLCHGKKAIQARRRTWTWNWGPRWKSVISTCLIF